MHQVNFFQMFWSAGLTVKFVMLLLFGFSLYSWYIIFQKHLLFKTARELSGEFLDTFWHSKNLAEAYKAASEIELCPEASIFKTGFTELQKLSQSQSENTDNETLKMRLAHMDNLQRSLAKATTLEMHRFGKSLSFLATTGSATPFIGLFGTVWGIMAAFQDIGMRGSATLAVVAPGISEALVATAAGLAVAIPAVVFYNFYSNKLDNLENDMHSFTADFLNLVERDLISRKS